MRNRKQYFVLTTVSFFLGGAMFVFGADYSTDSAAGPTGRPRPAAAKKAPQARRPSTSYSTEDITPAPTVTNPNTTTTSTRNHKDGRTKTAPHRPAAPNRPKSPDAAKAADGGGYPTVDGGTMNLYSYPYLAGRDLCSGGDRDGFWPGLLGIDLSYSWSGDSGGGEFNWCGYRYAWGDDPAYSDASDDYQAHLAVVSDPNATKGDYITYSTKDSRPTNYRYGPTPLSDANELPPDATERPKRKVKAAKDG